MFTVGEVVSDSGLRLMQIRTVSLDSSASTTVQASCRHRLPPDSPTWAAYLNDCEVTDDGLFVFAKDH